VDFKFTNDTPYHLLIETYTNQVNGSLTYKFYSTKDGRVVKISPPVVTKVVPTGRTSTKKTHVQAGPEGTGRLAVDGADVTVKRAIVRGSQAVTDTVYTRYEPWQAVFKVAPAKRRRMSKTRTVTD